MTKKYLEEKYQQDASRYTIIAKMLENWWLAVLILSAIILFLADSFGLKLFVAGIFMGYTLMSWTFTRLDIRERVRFRNVY